VEAPSDRRFIASAKRQAVGKDDLLFLGNIHRMILAELAKIFALALVVLTGLILLAGVISEAMKSGLGPTQILAAIPLLVPNMLPYTVPTTTLFATCIVYGRLAADNEFLALKAAGVHVFHVIWPAAFLGVVASAVTMILFLDVIPYSNCLLRSRAASDVEELIYALLRRDGCIRHLKLNYEINVKSMDGRKLHDVIFKRRPGPGKEFDTIVLAREAELRVDLARRQILIDMRQCEIVHRNNVALVHEQTWPVDIPDFLSASSNKQRASDMTWSELYEYEAKMTLEKEKLGHEIDLHRVALTLGRGGEHFHEHVQSRLKERRTLDGQIFALQAEYHTRPAFALGCICFALVGCPIGIWFSKSDYLSSFITCFLPIVIVYYPLMLGTINFARSGKIPPWLGVYDANALMLLAGGWLFWRLARN
jgi:lipopolysaccharide export system permease protein